MDIAFWRDSCYSGLDEDTAFLTVGAPILDTIVPAPTSPLLSSELFQKTVRSELNPHNGNFFIDIDSAFNPKNLALPEFPPNQKVWIDAMSSIGVTASVVGDRTTRYDAFVGLKKAAASTPSPGNSPRETSPRSIRPNSPSPTPDSEISPSPSPDSEISPSPSPDSESSPSPSPDSPSP